MLNLTELESTHARLTTYRDRLNALIDSMASFLALDTPAVAVPSAPPVEQAAAPAARPRTKGPTTPAQKQKLATKVDESKVSMGQRVLAALAATSPQRPSDLVEALGFSAHAFKQVTTRLEEQGLVIFSGKTINRRLAITEKGLKASRTAPVEDAQRPQSDADLVSARDAAVKACLKAGPATFEQLLSALPGTFPSAEAKASALKASLRRLELRSEVLDAGTKFKLRAA